jgi:hypothetical protein
MTTKFARNYAGRGGNIDEITRPKPGRYTGATEQ